MAHGSYTVAIPSLDITYRSRNGAVQESLHVFIEAGLKYKCTMDPVFTGDQQHVIQLFEMGFGTGLNALLTAKEALALKRKISYTTIEPEPLEAEIVQQLKYEDSAGYLRKMHDAAWGVAIDLHPYFTFTKYRSTLAAFDISFLADNFDKVGPVLDVVYIDAFGPLTQPELWSADSFSKIASWMKPGAVLTTYCSKSVVRRTMMGVGLQVKKIPGPYGKREMVRATK